MRVLVLYERSGIVREAFRKRGHDAYSVDIFPDENGRNRFHLEADLTDPEQLNRVMAYADWDLAIAHPVCTDLAVSGALRFKEKRIDGRQGLAIDSFMKMADLPIKRVCIENPVCIMSTAWRKPDQIIQPYEFGDNASKKTCLWLKNLPRLAIDPALYVEPRIIDGKRRWANQTDSGQNRLGPSDHRAADRAKTYPGIADAFAANWGNF